MPTTQDTKAKHPKLKPTHKAIVLDATRIMTASVRRGEALLALIDRRMARIREDFYDIGVALAEIKSKKLFAALGYRSFEDLVVKRVGMGHTQANKLVEIASSYEREQALSLGLEKAYQLVRYAEATSDPDSPKFLLETGAKIGRKAVAEASVRDLVAATRAVRAKTKSGRARDPEEISAARAAKALQASLHKRGARQAEVLVVRMKAAYWLRISMPVGEAVRV